MANNVYMSRVTVDMYDGRIDQKGFEYDETLSTPGDGDIILVPDSVNNISVTLKIDTGSGKVRTTTNKLQDVLNNTDLVWVDWDTGAIAQTTQDAVAPVTALKMVNISGTTRIMIRAQ